MPNDRYMPQVNTKQNFEKLPKTKLSSLQSMVCGGGLIRTMPKRIGVILLGYLSIAAPPLAPTPHPRIFLQLGHFVGCQQNTMFREKGFFSHEHLLKPIISSTNDHLWIAKLLSHPFWWLKLSSLILSSKQTDFVGCNSYIIFQTLILIYRVFFFYWSRPKSS